MGAGKKWFVNLLPFIGRASTFWAVLFVVAAVFLALPAEASAAKNRAL